MLLKATLISGDGISSLDLLVLYAVIAEIEYLAINVIILNFIFFFDKRNITWYLLYLSKFAAHTYS